MATDGVGNYGSSYNTELYSSTLQAPPAYLAPQQSITGLVKDYLKLNEAEFKAQYGHAKAEIDPLISGERPVNMPVLKTLSGDKEMQQFIKQYQDLKTSGKTDTLPQQVQDTMNRIVATVTSYKQLEAKAVELGKKIDDVRISVVSDESVDGSTFPKQYKVNIEVKFDGSKEFVKLKEFKISENDTEAKIASKMEYQGLGSEIQQAYDKAFGVQEGSIFAKKDRSFSFDSPDGGEQTKGASDSGAAMYDRLQKNLLNVASILISAGTNIKDTMMDVIEEAEKVNDDLDNLAFQKKERRRSEEASIIAKKEEIADMNKAAADNGIEAAQQRVPVNEVIEGNAEQVILGEAEAEERNAMLKRDLPLEG